MFDVYCQKCETRRLIFPGQVRGLVNDEHGIAVGYECWCGALGLWRTGRRAVASEPAAAAA